MFCPARALFTLHQFICTLLHYTKSHALSYITPSYLHFLILYQFTSTLVHYIKPPVLCYITQSQLHFVTFHQVTCPLLHYAKSPTLCYITPSHTLLNSTNSPALCYIPPIHLQPRSLQPQHHRGSPARAGGSPGKNLWSINHDYLPFPCSNCCLFHQCFSFFYLPCSSSCSCHYCQ